MRAPTLAFIFILAEYSIITGGDGNCGDPPEVRNALKVQKPKDSRFRMKCKDGFLRQAGTSNLFRCENNKWLNNPEFVCIRNPSLPDVTTQSHTSAPVTPVNQTSSSSTPTTLCVTTQAEKSTTTNRKFVLTKPYTTSTTTWTSQQTSQRSTTEMETTVTTSKTARITTSSTTEKENLTTVSTHSPSSLSTTTTVGYSLASILKGKEGITAGTIILVIIVASSATVAILFWRRRSRLPGDIGPSLIMMTKLPDTQQPLMNPITITSNCPQDSIQPPLVPFRDSIEPPYANFEAST